MKNKTKALTGIFASGALVFAGVYWSEADNANDSAEAKAEITQPAAKAPEKAASPIDLSQR